MSERPGVEVYHLSVDMSDLNSMTMLYRLSQGCVKEQHYGIALARVVDLPPRVLAVAEEVSKTIIARTAAKKESSRTMAKNKRRKLLLALKENLEQLRNSPMDNQTLLEWIVKMRKEFSICMGNIGNVIADNDSEVSDDEGTDAGSQSIFSAELASEGTSMSDST